jgi:sulfhydrogenase subunit beta (sulfur reductase)
MTDPRVIDLAGLDELIRTLRDTGWQVVGPRLRDGVVVLDDVRCVDDLPHGVVDDQQPGRYRTGSRPGAGVFDHAVGPHSVKNWLFPARELLRGSAGEPPTPERVALLGIRGCDLAAVQRLDHVLDRRGVVDERYVARRRSTLLIAVSCARPASTCLCTATGTGPAPGDGADLTLTELSDPDGHRFVVRPGSEAGRQLLDGLPTRPALDDDLAAEQVVIDNARRDITRTLPEDVPGVLRQCSDPSLWREVASRCLACGSCTSVCPTCFCTSSEDVPDLVTATASRFRTWESCFSSTHSFANGGPVRDSVESRYRQWVTHKMGTWWDQFGESGCVGCGRCVT